VLFFVCFFCYFSVCFPLPPPLWKFFCRRTWRYRVLLLILPGKQCRRQSIQSRSPEFFAFCPAKACRAECNYSTSINNLPNQRDIILIGVTSSEIFFPEHFCNYFKKRNIAHFSKGVWGSAASSPSGVRPGPSGADPGSQSIFKFYIA